MKLIAIIILFLAYITTWGQDYYQAAGVRSGNYTSICYKKHLVDEKTMEAMLSFNPYEIRIVGLKEFHKPVSLEFTDKLFIYYGYGIHAGLTTNDRYRFPVTYYDYSIEGERVYPIIGLDAILGVEYRVIRWPFVAGVDFIPYFNLFGPNYFNTHFGDIALSVKYTF